MKVSLILAASVVLMLVAGTVVGHFCGMQASLSLIYHSPLMFILWGALAVCCLFMLATVGTERRAATLMIHLSFLIILSGAAVSHFFSREGYIHLEQGVCSDCFFSKNDACLVKLPFSVELICFNIEFHQGTDAPMDYVSDVMVDGVPYRISMNRILRHQGYRFYQSGYDDDRMGSTLAVYYDPVGIGVTYAGYILLIISFVSYFFRKDSFFRTVLGRVIRLSAPVLTLLLFTQCGGAVSAADAVDFMNVIEPVAIIMLVAGVVLSVVYILNCSTGKPMPAWSVAAPSVISFPVFVWLSVLLGLRWAASGHIPLSSGSEMMLVIAWCAVCITVVLLRKYRLLQPAGLLVAGFALLVSYIGEPEPDLSQVAPVLDSPLLAVHVSLMMLAYTLFALAAFGGFAGVLMRRDESRASHIADICTILLYPAEFLLVIGTFTGAVWANVSWGSYWSWDPKETWALVSIMVYALPLHRRAGMILRSATAFNLFCAIAFLSILFTYFGVNFFLGGMHSYA